MHRIKELEAEVTRLREAYDELVDVTAETVALVREERDRARNDAARDLQREMAELRKRLAILENSP